MAIVVTGGCGYIGSHICVKLIESGYEVVVIDDFSNARDDVALRVGKITGHVPRVFRLDDCDARALGNALALVQVDGVIHLAGRKSVAEPARTPLAYYRANVTGMTVPRCRLPTH